MLFGTSKHRRYGIIMQVNIITKQIRESHPIFFGDPGCIIYHGHFMFLKTFFNCKQWDIIFVLPILIFLYLYFQGKLTLAVKYSFILSHNLIQLEAFKSKIRPYFLLPSLSLRSTLPIHCIKVWELRFSTLSKKIQASKFLISDPSRCLQAQNKIAFWFVSLYESNCSLSSLLVSIAILKLGKLFFHNFANW